MHVRRLIDRFVVDELSAKGEDAMRAHLRGCGACRAYFEEQTLLFRALARDPLRATPAEAVRIARRATGAEAPAQRALRDAVAGFLVFEPARAFAGALLVVLLATAGVVVAPRQGARTASAGVVHEPQNPVLAGTVRRAKASSVDGRPLSDGAPIASLSVLVVEEGGLLEVELARGGTLRVFPDSKLSLGPSGEQVVLERGKVWSIVEGGKGSFAVYSPHGTAEVLGTSFVVDATSPDATEVRVVEGRVKVTDAEDRGTVVVAAAQGTRLTPARAPTAPGRSSASDAAEWQRVLDRFFKNLEQGIKRGIDSLQRSISKGGR